MRRCRTKHWNNGPGGQYVLVSRMHGTERMDSSRALFLRSVEKMSVGMSDMLPKLLVTTHALFSRALAPSIPQMRNRLLHHEVR